jgi:hypothetical protein
MLGGLCSDRKRTILDYFGGLSGQKPDFCLIDEAPFEFVTGPNGKKIMFCPEEAQAIRASWSKSPCPSKIQQDLLEVRQLIKKPP